jgi:hypothetical protein
LTATQPGATVQHVSVTDVDRIRRRADIIGACGALSGSLAVTATYVASLRSLSPGFGGLTLLLLISCLALRALERRARGLPAVSYATVGAVLLFAMIAIELLLAALGIQGKSLGK